MGSLSTRLGLLLTAAAVVLGGCQTSSGSAQETLRIGVSADLPSGGLLQPDGTFTGFDIDLARYVARGLGWKETEIEFVALEPGERDEALVDGEVDMVVAWYGINASRFRDVDLAGPYYLAAQDLLVRSEESAITGPHSLDGRRVCTVPGTSAAGALSGVRYSPHVQLVEAPTYRRCVEDLLEGSVDAVTSSDVILAGFVQEDPTRLRIVGSPFVELPYGIGLPQGSPDVGVVNDLIQRALDDGSWDRFFEAHFGRAGLVPVRPAPGLT